MKRKHNPNVHAALLVAVGGYILYLAWMLFEKYRDGTGEMRPVLNVIAIIVLALGGLGTLFYGWTVYRTGKETETDGKDKEEASEEQDNQ